MKFRQFRMRFHIFMMRLSSVSFKWFSVAPTYVGLRNKVVTWVDAKWVDECSYETLNFKWMSSQLIITPSLMIFLKKKRVNIIQIAFNLEYNTLSFVRVCYVQVLVCNLGAKFHDNYCPAIVLRGWVSWQLPWQWQKMKQPQINLHRSWHLVSHSW